jgi:hypothetical protein
MEKKKFVYEIAIEAIPHTADTVEEALGTDYFNPDFGIDVHASMELGELFKDAICQCLMIKLRAAASGEKHDKQLMEYEDKKFKLYCKLQESIKLVRVVDI